MNYKKGIALLNAIAAIELGKPKRQRKPGNRQSGHQVAELTVTHKCGHVVTYLVSGSVATVRRYIRLTCRQLVVTMCPACRKEKGETLCQ